MESYDSCLSGGIVLSEEVLLLTTIDNLAFDGCLSLKEIEFPASIPPSSIDTQI